MKEIIDVRAEKFKELFKGKTVKQAQDQVTKNIEEKIKKPNKYDWNAFVKSIEC
jgi:enolase